MNHDGPLVGCTPEVATPAEMETSTTEPLDSHFESMAAPDGTISPSQLLELCRNRIPSVTAASVAGALSELRRQDGINPEDPVSLSEVRKVMAMLSDVAMDGLSPRRSELPLLVVPSTPQSQRKQRRGLWEVLAGAFSKAMFWREPTSRSPSERQRKKMKPTTKLILTVVIMTGVIALAVAGTAIGLAWTDAVAAREGTLEQEMAMVYNAIESFTVTQARSQALTSQYATGRMVVDIVEQVGYNGMVRTTELRQLTTTKLLGQVVDNLQYSVCLDKVSIRAVLLAEFLSEAYITTQGLSPETLVGRVNINRMKASSEVFLVSRPGGAGGLVLRTTLKSCNASLSPCTLGNDITALATLGLGGTSTAVLGTSYDGAQAFMGVAPVSALNSTVLLYIVSASALRSVFQTQAVDVVNKANQNIHATDASLELLVVNRASSGTPLTTMDPTTCANQQCTSDAAAAAALDSSGTQVALTTNYQGNSVIATGTDLPFAGISFVLELQMSDVKKQILTQLGLAGTIVNSRLNGTMELLLGKRVVVNGTTTFQFLMQPKFFNECAPNCGKAPGAAQPMINAAVLCIDGASTLNDYRGKVVEAAYACSSLLGAGFVYKIDDQEIVNRSIAQSTQYANDQNKAQSGSLELTVGRATTTPGTVQLLSDYRFRPSANCGTAGACLDSGTSAEAMARALKSTAGQVGMIHGKDYRGNRVFSAYVYSADLNVGFVLKVDSSEVEWPQVVELLVVLGSAIGMTLAGILVMTFSAQHMMNTIEATWERSRVEVQKQKEAFEKLVSAMYPSFASERLLSGDAQIVVEIPKATIFFSDICNFTMLSNSLGPTELLQWIGY
eukprot:RCo000927